MAAPWPVLTSGSLLSALHSLSAVKMLAVGLLFRFASHSSWPEHVPWECPPVLRMQVRARAACHSLRGQNLRNGVRPPLATFCWGSRLDGCHGERLLRGQPREKHCRMKSLGPQGPGLSPTNHRDKASPTYAVPVLPPALAAPIQPLQHPLSRAREAVLSRLPLHLPSTTAADSEHCT